MTTTVLVLIIVVVVLVIALAIGAALLARARRSHQLQDRYGPEYDRSVAETGDRKTAEAQLAEREKKHAGLQVRELEPAERDRFAGSWTTIQQGFVDDPVTSLRQADGLVVDVMRTRGFPTGDGDQQTEAVTMEHPKIAEQYRQARAVREATESGPVDTEQQRHALTSYRNLVDALLGTDHPGTGHSGPDHTNNGHVSSAAKEQTR